MRAAPRPTNISTNSDPESEKNGTPASPATALARSVLPVPGGPRGAPPWGSRAEGGVLLRVLQEVHHLDELGLGLVHPGHVVEGDLAVPGRVVDHGLVLADRQRPAAPALHPPHQEEPDAAEDRDGEQPGEEEGLEPRGPLDEAGELDALVLQLLDERRLVDPGQPRGRDALGLLVPLRLQLGHDLRVADEDLADLAAPHLLQQLAHRHRLRRRALRDHALDEEERGEGEEEVGAGELRLLLLVVVHGRPRFGRPRASRP